VKLVLRAGTDEVPHLERTEKAEVHRELILELYKLCKENLIRVHEELLGKGVSISYPALTAFCRRNGIGYEPPLPAGRYDFLPGQEMQHDTSPHQAKIGGKLRPVQTASLVLCYSRMTFVQLYPHFTRFVCKLFLTDALKYFGGAADTCMIDNTHVVVLRGTGKDMVAVPEMEAFGERFDFTFKAHEKGDANRSARVEGPFQHVENNFLAGREFKDWRDANREAIAWCDKLNASFSRKLHASRRELFVAEAPRLKPLPIWVPDVYQLHHRIVDIESYVSVHGCRYSAPYQLIGRQLEVRETKETIELFDGARLVATHEMLFEHGARATKPAHRPPRGQVAPENMPLREEHLLIGAAPELAPYIQGLKGKSPGRVSTALRKLFKMMQDYPRASFLEALRDAEHYGLYDLERVDRMILRNIRRDFFPNEIPSELPPIPSCGDEDLPHE
jgi:hypothetical protein